MKSPLEKINELELIIRDLHKMESKMLAGQFIIAYRDLRRMISFFEETKKSIIIDEKSKD